MNEQGSDPELLKELRTTTDLALRATKATIQAIGKAMSNLVVLDQHIWQTLTEMCNGLFSNAVEGFSESFIMAQKQSQQIKHFLPKRSSTSPFPVRSKSNSGQRPAKNPSLTPPAQLKATTEPLVKPRKPWPKRKHPPSQHEKLADGKTPGSRNVPDMPSPMKRSPELTVIHGPEPKKVRFEAHSVSPLFPNTVHRERDIVQYVASSHQFLFWPLPSLTINPQTNPTTTTVSLSLSPIIPNTTLLSTTPQPPLQCLRGVRLDTGVCLCPDEWTGETCNISKFCAEETLNGLTFPLTVVGQLNYSTQLCPTGTTNAGIPKASAQCLSSTRTFGEIKLLDCSLTMESIQSQVTNASLEQNVLIACNLQMLTSKPEQLTSQNITSAAKIVCELLCSTVLNETVAVAVLSIISQLMNVDQSQCSNDTYTAFENLTITLEDFTLRMSESKSGGLVQPNLAVQYLSVESGTLQVELYTLKGQSNNFAPDRVSLGTEAANTTISTGQPDEIPLTINLQEDMGNKNIGIGVVLYESDQFFKSSQFISQIGTKRRVMSISLTNQQMLDNLEFTMRPQNISGSRPHDFACVFWDYTQSDWSTEGCYKMLDASGGMQCKCNHTTNFAVLMSYKADYVYSEALNWISIVGCSLSIVGLVLTALYQIKTRKLRGTNSTMLLVNICICMTIYYLLFIFGINNPIQHTDDSDLEKNVILASDWHQPVDQGPCTPVTVLLQYFLLATFAWNTMYAAHVFFLISNGLNGPPKGFFTVAMTAGWGLPALIVGISLATTYSFKDPLGYRQEQFCWLASLDKEERFDPKRPMLGGFLLPLAAMLSFNIALLIYFSQTICCANPNLKSSRGTSLKKKMLSSFSLAVVLGLSWVIGYFVLITHDKTLYTILSVVFCLCNTTQGVQIFILFTLRSILKKRARDNLDSKTESKVTP
ncbi:adhesion G-protein coupled receptor G7-like [Myxocyprinus asiaticus]|uniref:adhesion G-protein coupled receptor G7-like n=1 Tax=Myxocyprinus asiaticus TaxID=70543 RepID=UPI002222C744|nr:adhesion G-protein coupled receptor G7-like [Myxocyprinus asiaticus]